MQLNSQDDLTNDLLEAGVVSWEDIVRSVKCFHYGRNSNRENLSLVWYERKGTCSSKHAFLKNIAELNQLEKVDLILVYYKMNESNTRGVGKVLDEHKLDFIPEAHCYLKVNGVELDVTTLNSSFDTYKHDILSSRIIEPIDVVKNKVKWHKEFMSNWINENKISTSLNELWAIREKCIQELEKH